MAGTRQMMASELQEALAVEIGKPALNRDDIPTVEHMIKACDPLVVIEEESNIIRLVHYTTQEYLERTQNAWFENAQIDITRRMATYLSFSAFNTGLCDSYDEFEERKATHKLYSYAAENWGHHAREALVRGMEAWELVDFLESDRKREAASQIAMARPNNYYGDKLRDVTATHLAGYFGTCEVMALLLEKGHSPSATDTYENAAVVGRNKWSRNSSRASAGKRR